MSLTPRPGTPVGNGEGAGVTKLFHGRGQRRRRGEEVRQVTGMIEGLQNLAAVRIDFTDDRDDIFQVNE